MNAYLRFCIYYERVPCPADKTTLKAYIAFLARSLKSTSIPCYLNVVRIFHVSSGYANPFENNWEVAMVKRGVSRVKGCPPVQKNAYDASDYAIIFAVFRLLFTW
jgi:hypothetical protein